MRYQGIPEEKLKNKVAHDWFSKFDTSVITGNIDFSPYPKAKAPASRSPLLWAEAKTGDYPPTPPCSPSSYCDDGGYEIHGARIDATGKHAASQGAVHLHPHQYQDESDADRLLERGERWGEDAARGEMRMRGVLVEGGPCGPPFFVRSVRELETVRVMRGTGL